MDNLQDLLKALECPVCFQLMVPPITQCKNGHNICHTCKPKLMNCPTCRGEFTDVRNKFTEQFSHSIEHPCKYKGSGCTKQIRLLSKKRHEKKCPYRPNKCPFFILDSIKCQWEGASTELEQHIRNEHKDESQVTVTSGKQSCGSPSYMKSIHSGSWYQLVFTLDRIFLCYSKIIGNFFYKCYMFVGARGDINNYKYTVSIKTTDGKHSVTATIPCPHYQEFIGGNFPNGKCAVFHKDFTKLCVNKEDKLSFEYEISQD